MELPPCPTCHEGCLLPLSSSDTAFDFWVCSSPGCAYVVSSSIVSVTYYKGSAVRTEKVKGDKKWTEFSF